MTLLAGQRLATSKLFFKHGARQRKGSSYDLTVGRIYNSDGKAIEGDFILKPQHMVQIVTSEEFSLPPTITGHVTYKTEMTSKGIWALTVGIVDPGWDGPISTTLLNFSKQEHIIRKDDPFLRVTFFEHDAVDKDDLRYTYSTYDKYANRVQALAVSAFPQTFLDTVQISKDAGNSAIRRISFWVPLWIAFAALFFTVLQVFGPYAPGWIGVGEVTVEKMHAIQLELEILKQQVEILRATE